MKLSPIKSFYLLIFLSFLLIIGASITLNVDASSSVGTIDEVYHYAKGIGVGGKKIDFGLFKGSIEVTVADTELSGFAWGENIGWINLSPSSGGVLNNKEGVLSGYATSEYGGLIDFTGVTIDSSGDFWGYAKSEKLGSIVFNCITDNSCATENFKLKTDWRPVSTRNNTPRPSSANIPLPAQKPIETILPKKDDTKNQNINDSNEIILTPKPLPIMDLSQYEGGGDVIKHNGEIVTNLKNENIQSINQNQIIVDNNKITEVNTTNKNNLPSDNLITDVTQKTKEVSSFVVKKTKEIKKEAVIISNSPAVEISTKTVTTAGVAGGSTAVFSSFAGSTLSLSEFFLNLLRIWTIFMSAIGLRKKSKPWGTVYDSVTKQPLDPAYVVLQDKDNKEIATAITDFDGRFGFLVPLGVYKIYVRKNNYSFPSRKLFGNESDELYENLYFGEYLNLKQDKLIIKNIPMDPEKFDWNEFAKKDKKLLKFSSPYAYIIAKISNTLFYLGFILAILLIIINGFNYYNFAIIFLYFVLFLLRMIGIKPKSFGTISEYSTGFPLSFAVLRVFQKESKKEIFHRVSDKYGRYFCLLPKGEYYVTIDKKNNDESYSNVFTSEIFSAKRGILNRDFKV